MYHTVHGYTWQANQMYYTYVLLDKNKEFYTGYCSDLVERLKKHKAGAVYATRGKLPIELIYYEGCLNKYDAIKREKFLKSGLGKKHIKLRLKEFLKGISGLGPV